MKGEAGAFFDLDTKQQIGGFFDWEFESRMDHALKETTRYLGWEAHANHWWGEKDIGYVEVRFYPDDGEFYWADEAMVGIHIKHPDVLVQGRLDMMGQGVLRAVELCKV